jgi:hypothetical protein
MHRFKFRERTSRWQAIKSEQYCFFIKMKKKTFYYYSLSQKKIALFNRFWLYSNVIVEVLIPFICHFKILFLKICYFLTHRGSVPRAWRPVDPR